MNITLTVEELKLYQDSCSEWARKAAMSIAEKIPTRNDFDRLGRFDDMDKVRKELIAIENSIPLPKLLPSV